VIAGIGRGAEIGWFGVAVLMLMVTVPWAIG
jgi:hypothetical protein